MMFDTEKKIRNYVILSYLVFWLMVLGICGTASMVFHCSATVMRGTVKPLCLVSDNCTSGGI